LLLFFGIHQALLKAGLLTRLSQQQSSAVDVLRVADHLSGRDC